jgi:signal transduction histidine kinase
MRRSWWRLALGLGMALLAVFVAQSLAHTLSGRRRASEQALRRVRDETVSRRGALEARLAHGRPTDVMEAARELPLWLFAELEVFDQTGQLVYAHPQPSGLSDWPAPDDLDRVRKGAVMTAGPVGVEVDGPRILTYVSITYGLRPVIVRLASPAFDLVAEQRERRDAAFAQGAALVVLLVATVLVVLPTRGDPVDAGGALRAYEEAMGRLQARGVAVALQHEMETERLRSALDDKNAMARAGELTAGMVHEVRNGLGTIAGYAQLLEREAPSPGAAEAARQIREECATLETVVRRFMDFVKSESLTLAPLELGRMLTRVAAREGRAPGAAVVLPQPMPGVTILGDEEMLERAFENVVRNGREAAGTSGHVWIEIAVREDDVIVGVRDDGPGMPPERREAVRPFASSKGSLGLGLPIALKIVRLHGGDLVLAEGRPRGLHVAVRLPQGGPPQA